MIFIKLTSCRDGTVFVNPSKITLMVTCDKMKEGEPVIYTQIFFENMDQYILVKESPIRIMTYISDEEVLAKGVAKW